MMDDVPPGFNEHTAHSSPSPSFWGGGEGGCALILCVLWGEEKRRGEGVKEGGDTEEREAAVMEPGRCGVMKMRGKKRRTQSEEMVRGRMRI